MDSVVIGVEDAHPFRVWYEIRTDGDWKVRECSVRLLRDRTQEIVLHSDSEGHWQDAQGRPLSTLDGCVDVDISCTPVTNTLPIRRLSFTPGESASLLMVYVAVPEMTIKPMPQRYTCLESSVDGGLYRYESLDSGFTAELRVDANGFVIDYPGLFKRA